MRDELPLLRTLLAFALLRELAVHIKDKRRRELRTEKELQRPAGDLHIADLRAVFVSVSLTDDFMGQQIRGVCVCVCGTHARASSHDPALSDTKRRHSTRLDAIFAFTRHQNTPTRINHSSAFPHPHTEP